MYLPNPMCKSPIAIQMFEFMGKLLVSIMVPFCRNVNLTRTLMSQFFISIGYILSNQGRFSIPTTFSRLETMRWSSY